VDEDEDAHHRMVSERSSFPSPPIMDLGTSSRFFLGASVQD